MEKEREYLHFLLYVMQRCYVVSTTDIIEQDPEMLVFHHVGHNIDHPFAIVVTKGLLQG